MRVERDREGEEKREEEGEGREKETRRCHTAGWDQEPRNMGASRS